MNAREAAVKIDAMVDVHTGQRVFTRDNPETGSTEFTEAGRKLFRMLVDLQGPVKAAEPQGGMIALGDGTYRVWSNRRSAVTGRFDQIAFPVEDDS